MHLLMGTRIENVDQLLPQPLLAMTSMWFRDWIFMLELVSRLAWQ
ncbi:hypothetical protein [Variovorax boronicumulans]